MSFLSATPFVKVWNTFGTFRFLKVIFSQIFWITGKAAALHGSTDDDVAVLGADFTLAYFHRLLWETLPFCSDRTTEVMTSATNIRCFLMDERGYLLAHPNLSVLVR